VSPNPSFHWKTTDGAPDVSSSGGPGITPNTNFPFLESLKQIGGGVLVGAFIVIAIVAIIGAATLLAGKLSQSSRLASGGGMILLWTGPVAGILGGINGYILWSQTALPLGF
jgi:type IV secretion system protein TrbC